MLTVSEFNKKYADDCTVAYNQLRDHVITLVNNGRVNCDLALFYKDPLHYSLCVSNNQECTRFIIDKIRQELIDNGFEVQDNRYSGSLTWLYWSPGRSRGPDSKLEIKEMEDDILLKK